MNEKNLARSINKLHLNATKMRHLVRSNILMRYFRTFVKFV